MNRLNVNEIFWSAQGEGVRKGISSIFIRLSGCSLGCSYCDSEGARFEGEYSGVDEIIFRIKSEMRKYPSSQIVITGGEPLEQDISFLVNRLKDDNLYIAIETNGIHFQDLEIDWWAVSPKDINGFKINDSLWRKISEIKLLVNDNLYIKHIRAIVKKKEGIPIFLQPQFPEKDRFQKTFGFYEMCIREGLENVRLGTQMHRNFGIR